MRESGIILSEKYFWQSRQRLCLATRYFVIHPGPEEAKQLPGKEYFQRLENVARTLSIIAERCRYLGMTCVLENKLPHLLFGDVRDIIWILEALKGADVGVCLDTGHAYLAGDLWNVAQKLSGRLKIIHASDNKGKYDDHLPPGEGAIDWLRFLGSYTPADFQGSIIMEIAGKGETQRILELRHGRMAIDRVVNDEKAPSHPDSLR